MNVYEAFEELNKLYENQWVLNTQYVFDLCFADSLPDAEKDKVLDKILDDAAEDILDSKFENRKVNAKVAGHFKIGDFSEYCDIVNGKQLGHFTSIKKLSPDTDREESKHLYFGLDVMRERTTGSLPIINSVMFNIENILDIQPKCSISALYRSSYIPSNSVGQHAGWLDAKDLELRDHNKRRTFEELDEINETDDWIARLNARDEKEKQLSKAEDKLIKKNLKANAKLSGEDAWLGRLHNYDARQSALFDIENESLNEDIPNSNSSEDTFEDWYQLLSEEDQIIVDELADEMELPNYEDCTSGELAQLHDNFISLASEKSKKIRRF